MSMSSEEAALKASNLAKRCRPIFADEDPDAVGAALCELVALHLAAISLPGEANQTALMRDMLLEAHVETVKKLVPIMEAMHTLPKLREKMQ